MTMMHPFITIVLLLFLFPVCPSLSFSSLDLMMLTQHVSSNVTVIMFSQHERNEITHDLSRVDSCPALQVSLGQLSSSEAGQMMMDTKMKNTSLITRISISRQQQESCYSGHTEKSVFFWDFLFSTTSSLQGRIVAKENRRRNFNAVYVFSGFSNIIWNPLHKLQQEVWRGKEFFFRQRIRDNEEEKNEKDRKDRKDRKHKK